MAAISKLAVLVTALLSSVSAHSWVEQMQQISDDGSFTGPMGYPRGYVARTDPGFTGDSMNYLLPALSSGRTRVNEEDLLCHPNQRTAKQSDNYPLLSIQPGGYVAMKYLENGHVTLPANQKGKAKSGGTVFVYGTAQPKDDEKIMDVLKWTGDGHGGDGRGKMLAAQNFDDGRCHQINAQDISKQRQQEFPDRVPDQPESNVEQWCETDVKIPNDASGTLTLYWVWQWSTAPGADPTYPQGKDEFYTTCSDVNLQTQAQAQGSRKNVAEKNTLQQQDPQTKAPDNFRDRTAYIKTPLDSSADKGNDHDDPTPSTSTSTSTRRHHGGTGSNHYPPTSSAGADAPGKQDGPTPSPIYITVTVTATAAPSNQTSSSAGQSDHSGTTTTTSTSTSAPNAGSIPRTSLPDPSPPAQQTRPAGPQKQDNSQHSSSSSSSPSADDQRLSPDALAAEPRVLTASGPCTLKSTPSAPVAFTSGIPTGNGIDRPTPSPTPSTPAVGAPPDSPLPTTYPTPSHGTRYSSSSSSSSSSSTTETPSAPSPLPPTSHELANTDRDAVPPHTLLTATTPPPSKGLPAVVTAYVGGGQVIGKDPAGGPVAPADAGADRAGSRGQGQGQGIIGLSSKNGDGGRSRSRRRRRRRSRRLGRREARNKFRPVRPLGLDDDDGIGGTGGGERRRYGLDYEAGRRQHQRRGGFGAGFPSLVELIGKIKEKVDGEKKGTRKGLMR